jgi:hypothetical protein
MHSGCFDLFYATVIDRAESQNNLILDTSEGFYQCPLCKKLGNVLLPHTSRDGAKDVIKGGGAKEEVSSGSEEAKSEWIAWMTSVHSRSSSSSSSGVPAEEGTERQWKDVPTASSLATPPPTPTPPLLPAITSSSSSSSATENRRTSILGQASASLKRIHDSLMSPPSSPHVHRAQEQGQEQNHQRQRQERDGGEEHGVEEEFEMSVEESRGGTDTGTDNISETEEEEEKEGDRAGRRSSSSA